MKRRIGIWALFGFGVAAVWVLLSFLLPHGSYNFGRSNLVAITAPAALLGRSMAMKYYTFIALNAGIYALVGTGAEIFRKRIS